MRLKHTSFETSEPCGADLGFRLSSLRRTVRRPEVGYRIAVSLAILLLTPVLFEYLVRTFQRAGSSPSGWIALDLGSGWCSF